MLKADNQKLEEMVDVAQVLLKERPDDVWLRRGLHVMQAELNKVKGIPNIIKNTEVKMEKKNKKFTLNFKDWDLYITNIFLIFPFIPIYCILSVLLPIHSDNTTFYASGILFMLATILLPVEKIMQKYFSDHKILKNMPIIHGSAMILSLLFFAYWMLTLTNW